MECPTKENIVIALGALVSAIATGVLSVSFAALIMILASQITVRMAFAQTRPAVELEGAIAKEQVDGDLKSAIGIYQRIAAEGSAPRDVRAKALLHLAGCYEKLGQQAQTVYQQIVRDFADQPAAVQARARLTALKQDDHPAPSATMTQRKIEVPGFDPGPGDTDGHRAVYLNKGTGELIYGDLGGKTKRVIFKTKPGDELGSFPSRDFSIVLLRVSKPDEREVYSVIKTDGTGYREVARLDSHLGCLNWSWDNRHLLGCSQSEDGTSRLMQISVTDGQIRELLNLKTGVIRSAAFSPDGRFVAYQLRPPPADPVSRIFVLPVEAGVPRLVYEERLATGVSPNFQAVRLLDWTADGCNLAIASERSGKGALHLLPIRNGKSAGAPVFVKYGEFESGVTTAAGGLVYASVKPGGNWAVYFASLDPNGRAGDWKRLDLHLGNTLNPAPQWSADSNEIVYVARNEDVGQSGGQIVHLHSLSTGEDREIYHALGYASCIWAVHERKLFCRDITAQKTDILSIAVDSGEIERLDTFSSPTKPLILYPSRDDRALYLLTETTGELGGELLRWEIATKRTTVLERFPATALGWISPDGRWSLRLDKRNLEIRPSSGGDWRRLVSLNTNFTTGHFSATPDGNWLIYHDIDSAGKHSLFRIATAGGQPERLGDFPTSSGSGTLEVSPDERKIIVASGDYSNGTEFWSLENFVPSAPKQ